MVSPPLVEFRNIAKKFGDFYAVRDICLEIRQGEIHAIAGENGAGKTTLMKVLFGELKPDAGSLALRGRHVSFRSPRDAVQAGIGMVHQDILLFPQLSVLENIVVGFEPSWPSSTGPGGVAGLIKKGPAKKAINEFQGSLGFQLDTDRLAKDLSFALKQQMEIVRMLYRGAEILILDEPTSLLSPHETDKFLDLMKSLRAGGRTVLFISHRMAEIFSVADRITVLKGGKIEATMEAGATDMEEIARLMVNGLKEGQPTSKILDRDERSAAPGQASASDLPALELRNLRTGPSGTEPALLNISISVARGEVFGLSGVVGNGQGALAGVLAGKIVPAGGSILFYGKEISRLDIKKRLANNILWLQENPLEEALLPERPLWENFLLGRQRRKEFAKAGFIRRKVIFRFSEELITANDIAASGPFEALCSLSGGNRQKVALARILAGPPSLAILEQPCRGLDVRAARDFHDHLLELSRVSGVSFILISYDFDELLSICDRIAVIYRGEIIGTAESANLSREMLGRWVAGLKTRGVSSDE
jgi:simple sugar transport system ATP-binding protein